MNSIATISARKSEKAGGTFLRLMIRMNWGNERASFGTGITIEEKHWDEGRKWIKVMRGSTDQAMDLRSLNAKLRKKVDYYEEHWAKLEAISGDFTAAQFKAYLNGDLDPVRGTTMDFLPGCMNSSPPSTPSHFLEQPRQAPRAPRRSTWLTCASWSTSVWRQERS